MNPGTDGAHDKDREHAAHMERATMNEAVEMWTGLAGRLL